MPSFKSSSAYKYAYADKLPVDDQDDGRTAVLQVLRRHSAQALVRAAQKVLWAKFPTALDVVQSAPWHILLLLKWAFQDPKVPLRVGAPVSEHEFNVLRQMLLDLTGSEYRRRKPENVFLMLRSHLQQLDFQRPEGWGFLRWPALIARQPPSHPSRRQFISEIGMPPEHFMDLAFALQAAVMDGITVIGEDWFAPMQRSYGESIRAMWRLVARDFISLRFELQRDGVQRLPLAQELHEPPYLKRFPFLKGRDGRYACWHPMVVARALEDIVHYRLSELQGDYTQPFSRLFERYVMELSKSMCADAILDEEYQSLTSGSTPSNVEALIPFGSCNVMVEAKMSLFGDDVLLADNEKQAYQKTKKIRDAIKQAWNVGRDIRASNSPVPPCKDAEQDFLLVVTSRELFIGDGEKLARLYKEGEFAYPDEASKRCLPLANVFVLSIENFERLSIAIATGKVSLPALMREAVERNRDPSTSAILFDDFLGKYVDKWGLTQLIQTARDESDARIRALGDWGETGADVILDV